MAVYDAIIIGGGLGGLLCGNILSKEGLKVCLIEKNHKLGGSLQTFGRRGTIFNTGLNYTESLGSGQVLNQYFKYFGLTDRLTFKKLDEKGFEVISFNDRQFRFAMGAESFLEAMISDFPGEKDGLKTYLKKIHDICMAIPLYTFSGAPSNIIDNTSLNQGAYNYIKSVISNPRLQNILAGNSMLYSGTANYTPLYIHALINNSFIESAWRIAGGSHLLVNILANNITDNGGTILKQRKVARLGLENGRASFVELEDGEQVHGKNFIANIHPAEVLKIVEPSSLRKTYTTRIKSLEDTMGMFTLYLVFKKESFPYHNYNFYHFNQDNTWVASDYRSEHWPQNYLYMPVAMTRDDQFAKSGSVITYMNYKEVQKWENTFTGERGDDYIEFKNEKAEILLDSVEKQFPGFREHIDSYYTSTPLTWRDYTGTRNGSAYGIVKDFNRPLETLILPRTHIPNFFLTGQNNYVHGILGVTISSVVTCSGLIDEGYLVKKIKSA
ncbi:MAG TPA: FAD-dependent oxidoreductase [Bacteroidales bacterium]|nr:FAD-dependent oxidoreductase [Bacteroidales bacterium]